MIESNDDLSTNGLLSNDDLLNQELSNLVTDASIAESDEVAEVAKVKLRKKDNSVRSSGDNASVLLAGLIEDTAKEAEKEEITRAETITSSQELRKVSFSNLPKTEKEVEEDRKLEEARRKLEEETKKLEETKMRRTQILAAIERQKKIEAGELAEEEEERKRKEKEEAERIEAERKAAQEAEIQKAKQRIEEQQAKIKELTPEPPEPPAKKRNRKIIISVVAAVIVIATAAALFYVDQSRLAGNSIYEYSMVDHREALVEQKLEVAPTASIISAQPLALKTVTQEAPVEEKRTGSRGSGSGGQRDVFGLGKVTGNVLGTTGSSGTIKF